MGSHVSLHVQRKARAEKQQRLPQEALTASAKQEQEQKSDITRTPATQPEAVHKEGIIADEAKHIQDNTASFTEHHTDISDLSCSDFATSEGNSEEEPVPIPHMAAKAGNEEETHAAEEVFGATTKVKPAVHGDAVPEVPRRYWGVPPAGRQEVSATPL